MAEGPHHDHTRLGMYVVVATSIACGAVQTAQSLLIRLPLYRKYYLLAGALCFFAYSWARPYIRSSFGSATRAYINLHSLYILWLCSAVFYHLPSLETMGLDAKADLSLLIVAFVATLTVLITLHGGHVLGSRLIKVYWTDKATQQRQQQQQQQRASAAKLPGSRRRPGAWDLVSVLILNSVSLALACSTYHSFCGNGVSPSPTWARGSAPGAVIHATHSVGLCSNTSLAYPGSCLPASAGASASVNAALPARHLGTTAAHNAVCLSWLHPIPTTQFPKFSAWMLLGEPTQGQHGAAGHEAHGKGGSQAAAGEHADRGADGSASHQHHAAAAAFESQGNGSSSDGGSASTPSRQGSGHALPPPPPQESTVLSPVLTLWITLFMLYLTNCLADLSAAASMEAQDMGELRHQALRASAGAGAGGGVGSRFSAPLSALQRFGRSAVWNAGGLHRGGAGGPGLGDAESAAAPAWPGGSLHSWARRRGMLDVKRSIQKPGSFGAGGGGGGARSAARPGVAAAAVAASAAALGSARDTAGTALLHTVASRLFAHSLPNLSVLVNRIASGPQEATSPSPSPKAQPGPSDDPDPAPGPQPDFLPMVPWYSGTSADLLKTCFDLIISVKLFLGRFDMRTMQAATAASMADSFNDTPSAGDGFTFEHLDDRKEIWVDFIADTGDGGNSTYSVARALAAPHLHVPVGAHHIAHPPTPPQPCPSSPFTTKTSTAAAKPPPASTPPSHLVLPRGELLLIGGDLAYPNPGKDTYEQRLFRPFEAALPPPPHYHPGRLVVHKPDLPPVFGVQGSAANVDGGREGVSGMSPRSSRHGSIAALRRYSGPTCFAIPGNHDWFDGLYTFLEFIVNRGWLGGWLLPQEKSYFAVKLPQGWWVFGLDLALGEDIDIHQYRYFANVVEQRLGPSDQVMVITHQPLWLLDWFWQNSSAPNLRQLVRGHLRGRARVHLAGDLHFYMRHSYTTGQAKPPPQPPQPPQQHPGEKCDAAKPEQQQPGQSIDAAKQKQKAGSLLTAVSLSNGCAPTSPAQGSSACGAPGSLGQDTALSQPGPHPSASTAPPPSSASVPTAASVGQTDTRRAVSSLLQDPSWPALGMPDTPNLAPLGHKPQALMDGPAPLPGSRTQAPAGSAPPAPSSTLPYPIPASNGALARGRRGSASVSSMLNMMGGAEGGGGGLTPGPAHGSPVGGCWYPEGVLGGYQQDRRSRRPVGSSAGNSEEGSDGEESHVGSIGSRGTGGGGGGARRRTGSYRVAASPLPGTSPPSGGPRLLHVVAGPSAASHAHAHSRPLPAALILEDLGLAARSTRRQPPLCPACLQRQQSGGADQHPMDPDHLICNGSGGAFLHPTHLFVGAAFGYTPDAAAEATRAIYSNPLQDCTCKVYSSAYSGFNHDTGTWHYPAQPKPLQHSATSVTLASTQLPTAASGVQGSRSESSAPAAGPSAAGQAPPPKAGQPQGSTPGMYTCQASYPSPEESLNLGRLNLHLFRLNNTRFDVIGGVLYFLLVVSVIPRCTSVAAVLDADSCWDMARAALAAYWEALGVLVLESYLSLAVTLLVFVVTFGLARSGGVGANKDGQLPQPPPPWAPVQPPQLPFLWARCGGFPMQLLFGFLHCFAHVSTALVLMLMLELGVETCIRYEQLGLEGSHSLYRWYRAFEEQHFPDPKGVRLLLETWTLGLYPGAIKLVFALFDVPEAIAVARTAMCSAGKGLEAISRMQAVAYYAGMLAYYWLLATPVVGLVFGVYLYTAVCWFGVHYDEAFSSLRIPHFKALTRMHITREGDLEIFTLAIRRVPSSWREDPKWKGSKGGGNADVAAHNALYPSRWIPNMKPDHLDELELVDYAKVEKRQQQKQGSGVQHE